MFRAHFSASTFCLFQNTANKKRVIDACWMHGPFYILCWNKRVFKKKRRLHFIYLPWPFLCKFAIYKMKVLQFNGNILLRLNDLLGLFPYLLISITKKKKKNRRGIKPSFLDAIPNMKIDASRMFFYPWRFVSMY
jgi:hypothetical protein